MQRFSLILSIILIFLIGMFCCESELAKVIMLSFMLIILFISGYSCDFKFTFFLFSLTVFLVTICAFLGIGVLNIPILVFNFSIVALTSHFFQESFKAYTKDFEKNIKSLNVRFSELKNEDLKVLQKNKQLEVKVNEIEDLYELTKEMSVDLEFKRIFEILRGILKKRFNFKKCTLIYVKKTEEAGSKIDKILRIPEDYLQEKNQITETDKYLFKYFLKDNEPVLIKESHNLALREKLNLPPSTETFIAIPLIVEKELIGILSMEDLKEEGFERFIIAAGQFALEMKKSILYETVEELALTDGLTRLFVRRHFLKRLEEEIDRSKKYKLPLALLMIDIDHFKKCNDSYGHLVGDVVLREVSDVIKKNIREVDLAGRYGGEEFCIALPETNKEGARHVADRIRQAVEEREISAYDEIIHITVSIGFSLYDKNQREVMELIAEADNALYKAKNTGRNKVCEYEK